MDRRAAGVRSATSAEEPAARPEPGADPEAIEFVRFCYRRRRVGWPELYDEMCAVANRGIYRGLGADDLAGIGIGFSLFEMPALAALVTRIVNEDQDRRRRTVAAIRASLPAGDPGASRKIEDEPAPADAPPQLVAVPAGA